jgi:hypothetical protein
MLVMVSKLSVLPIDPVSVLLSLLLLSPSLSSGGIWVSKLSVLPIVPVSMLSSLLLLSSLLRLLPSLLSVLSSSGGRRENAVISSLGASLGVGSSWCSESS